MSHEEAIRRFRELPIVAHAFARLAAELPANLYYHSAAHTADVFSEVLLFATKDKLSDRACELLAIAAAYHDLGFILRATDNESLGAEMVVEALKKYGGYSPEDQQLVKAAVLDTQVKMTAAGPRQVSTSELSNYLLDADVSNLGREDFLEKVDLIQREIAAPDRGAFLKGVKVFFEAQRWYSPAAMQLRGAGKDRNRRVLDEELRKYS